MPLFLVRHGETEWNLAGRAQGHTDIPLSDVGRAQAQCLRHAFEGIRVDLVLSSDLIRSYATSQAIADATGAPVEKTPDLRERCFGDWEGMNYEIVNRQLDEQAHAMGTTSLEVAPPNGESYADVWKRLDPVMERLETLGKQNWVISSHGGALSVLLSRLMRGSVETARSFRLRNTSVSELRRRPDGYWALERLNDVGHLSQIEQIAVSTHGVPR